MLNLLKYRAPKFNEAQRVLMACGVDDLRLYSHHHEGGNESHTKSGPGRRHAQGQGERPNAKPVTPRAGIGFPQHENRYVRDFIGGWKLGALIGPHFGNQRQHQYFYGVAPEFATPERPAYDAPGGYSGWRAIDGWGLNDEEIARTGRLTEEYLERSRPALIVFHAYSSPIMPLRRVPDRWDAMVLLLRDFAEARRYRLAASFGVKPDDTHTFYVRPDLPDTDRLVEGIRAMRYYYAETGELSLDFAHLGR